MARFGLLVLALSLTAPAFGRTVTCYRPAKDGAARLVFKNVGQKNMTVHLFAPKGESAGRSVSGRCAWVNGAIEEAYNCTLFTSTDSGYYVYLGSLGSSALVASYRSWNMSGEGPNVGLPCPGSENH